MPPKKEPHGLLVAIVLLLIASFFAYLGISFLFRAPWLVGA